MNLFLMTTWEINFMDRIIHATALNMKVMAVMIMSD